MKGAAGLSNRAIDVYEIIPQRAKLTHTHTHTSHYNYSDDTHNKTETRSRA